MRLFFVLPSCLLLLLSFMYIVIVGRERHRPRNVSWSWMKLVAEKILVRQLRMAFIARCSDNCLWALGGYVSISKFDRTNFCVTEHIVAETGTGTGIRRREGWWSVYLA